MSRKGGNDRGLFERWLNCPKCKGEKGGCKHCKHHKDGKINSGWYARWTDDRGKDHKVKCTSKTQAREVYESNRSEAVVKKHLPKVAKAKETAKKMVRTVGDAIDSYLLESEATKRSYADDKRYGEVWKNELGERRLISVKPDDVRAWRQKKLAEGVTPATVNRHVAFLRRVYNIEIENDKDGGCETNPAARVKKLQENNERKRHLSPEEETALRNALSERWWAFLEGLIQTGLRMGEYLSLRWENIDFKTGEIAIPRSKHGEWRAIPMNARVRELLEALPRQKESPWVFPGINGGHIHYSTFRNRWDSAIKKTKLKNLKPHDLRHTFASRLVMAGVDLRTVQELLGHKTITMTQRYAHLSKPHLADAVEKMSPAKQPLARLQDLRRWGSSIAQVGPPSSETASQEPAVEISSIGTKMEHEK